MKFSLGSFVAGSVAAVSIASGLWVSHPPISLVEAQAADSPVTPSPEKQYDRWSSDFTGLLGENELLRDGVALEPAAQPDEKLKLTIPWDQVEEKLTITGKLGKPLGMEIPIVGRWEIGRVRKGLSRHFVILQIDGQLPPTGSPIDFTEVEWHRSIPRDEPLDGEVWSCMVQEFGHWQGSPLPEDDIPFRQGAFSFGFCTGLNVSPYSIRVVDDPFANSAENVKTR